MTQPDKLDPSTAASQPTAARRIRPRALWWRWTGLATVALAIVLATPIAVSFVPAINISCPARSQFPAGADGVDWRSLSNGVLWQDRVVTRLFPNGRYYMPETPGPFSFRWERTPRRTRIELPIWPVPILLGALGAFWWHRGNKRIRAVLIPQGRTLPGDSRWRSLRRSTTVGIGLVSASVITLSFATRYGVRAFFSNSGERPVFYVQTHAGIQRGSVTWLREADRPGGDTLTRVWMREPGPLRMWWHADSQLTSICIPVWPLAVVLFGTACIIVWHRERAILRTLRGCCPACAYPLAVAQTQCPECGKVTASDEQV